MKTDFVKFLSKWEEKRAKVGWFLMHKLYLNLLFSLKIDKKIKKKGSSEQIFKNIQTFKNLKKEY